MSKSPLSARPGVVEEEGFLFWTEGSRVECPSWLIAAFEAFATQYRTGATLRQEMEMLEIYLRTLSCKLS